MPLDIQSAKQFADKIEKVVSDTKMNYLDSILYYCEENRMEPETAASLVGGKLKQKLREEAEELHFLPKTSKLPL